MIMPRGITRRGFSYGDAAVAIVVIIIVAVAFVFVFFPRTRNQCASASEALPVCVGSISISPQGTVSAKLTNGGISSETGVFVAEAEILGPATGYYGACPSGDYCYYGETYGITTTLAPGQSVSVSVGTGAGNAAWTPALVAGTYQIVTYFYSCWPSTTCLSLGASSPVSFEYA